MSDINMGAITEALNDKSDRDLRNVDNTAGADAVIEYQVPTAENGYTWYRKYKSGWVEQGGHYNGNITAGNGTQIILPIVMADTHYNISITAQQRANDWAYAVVKSDTPTTNYFYVFCGAGSNSDLIIGVYWQVCGMAGE